MDNADDNFGKKVSYKKFTKSVLELKGFEFYIPSYQRGYRWTPLQVKQLLDDIYDFPCQSDAWYCMHPLVVQQKGRGYVVVDGQQRLTTLSIVLSVVAGMLSGGKVDSDRDKSDCRMYSLTFERDQERTEEKKAETLLKGTFVDVPDEIRNAYADNFCMCEAASVIRSWIKKKFGDGRIAIEEYAQRVISRVRFIWYIADSDDETGYKVFERLNSGKIALSNAELIKALLLCKGNLRASDGKTEDVLVNEVAKEWDEVERQLQNDDFWCFINPESGAERFLATRIDFLFELLLRCEILAASVNGNIHLQFPYELNILYKSDGTFRDWVVHDDFAGACGEFDYVGANRANPYFVFYALTQSECDLDNVWAALKFIFKVMKRWYNERRAYHLVGYLMNQKNSSIETLVKLICEVSSRSHSDFINNVLLADIRHVIGFEVEKSKYENGTLRNEDFERHLASLSYNDKDTNKSGKVRIYDVLLLFNIILMDRQASELSRYPFAAHSKITAGWRAGWSLEHIHAKQEEIVEDDLRNYEQYFNITRVPPEMDERLKALNEPDRLNKFGLMLRRDLEEPSRIRLEIMRDGMLEDDETITHGIGNMALLDCSRNAEFNNRSYIRKREILSEWERGDRESHVKVMGDFVPVGTRMAFYKHYAKNIVRDFPLAWTYENRCDYESVIARTIITFLTPEDERKGREITA